VALWLAESLSAPLIAQILPLAGRLGKAVMGRGQIPPKKGLDKERARYPHHRV